MSLFKNYFFYNLLEKYTLVFGDLFSDIQVQKIGENGDVISTITVPVNYAEKEKWAQRQLDDSDLSRKPAIILPRISYQYTDINYDGNRKLARNEHFGIVRTDETKNLAKKVYTPTPYIINFEVDIIAKTLNLNKLLLPLSFDENDLKEIINSFSKIDKKKGNLPEIPERDIDKKNQLNNLSKEYFNNVIKKNLIYLDQIRDFLMDPINSEYLNKYENTIDDINEEIIVHRDDFDKFDMIFNYLYKFIIDNNPELSNNRNLVRLFLHYMYYNCDIGINE